MGLFTRRPGETSSHNYYTSNTTRTILIVGLGNIGKQYDKTRHNIGFAVLDDFVKHNEFPAWSEKKDLRCMLSKQLLGNTMVLAIKPTTYMNESGQAVHLVQQFFKVTNKNTIVVHDDLDVQFGQIRARVGGGSAGNNGIKSLISHCGEDFARIRIGIKNLYLDNTDSADFVLSKFNKDELSVMPKLNREVSALISEYLATHQLPHDTRNFLL